MAYTKISPLGPRRGPGTFDGFFDLKHKSMEDAIEANDIVVVDFVKDEQGIVYFDLYHSQKPEEHKYMRLNYQHFPAGVDILDDQLCGNMAETLFLK